ncbi:hypothetical protein SynPROSU1_02843 [Synechococcus sp. PROS-U-1]|nr:hypothetical protein SynPROSU1_02843 [Synechococcus sp. PROS-U-1]
MQEIVCSDSDVKAFLVLFLDRLFRKSSASGNHPSRNSFFCQ